MTHLIGWHWVLVGWLAFAGVHLLLSSKTLRGPLIAGLGEQGFRGIYSLAALATFVWLVITYTGNKHTGPLLWNLTEIPAIRETSLALSFAALVLTIAAVFQARPTDMGASLEQPALGLTRITRHPTFVFFGIFALSHMLVNGHLSDVVFFGGFPAFVWIGCVHMDSRKRAIPALESYYAQTSLLPFAAIVAGRNRIALGEVPLRGVLAGVVVTGVLFAFHSQLFGG